MRKFDFYEFAGILVPGTVTLTGISIIIARVGKLFASGSISVGGLGLFLILAYAAGHLVQALGNLIEWAWWKLCGGMPTDWVTKEKQELLAPEQLGLLKEQVTLITKENVTLDGMDRRAWYPIVRQIYAAVSAAGRTQRVDVFNGNYGLNRGIAASLSVVLAVLLLSHGFADWRAGLVLVAGIAVAIYRMHRFGRHYGRELFVQFLALPAAEDSQGDQS